MSGEERADYSGHVLVIREDAEHPQVPDFGGSEFRVEGWWDEITGKSWMLSDGNPAAMVYGFRRGLEDLPIDDLVLYGKIGAFGHLVHISEIDTEEV